MEILHKESEKLSYLQGIMKQQKETSKVRSYKEHRPLASAKSTNYLNIVPEIEIDLSATTVLNQTLAFNSSQNDKENTESLSNKLKAAAMSIGNQVKGLKKSGSSGKLAGKPKPKHTYPVQAQTLYGRRMREMTMSSLLESKPAPVDYSSYSRTMTSQMMGLTN